MWLLFLSPQTERILIKTNVFHLLSDMPGAFHCITLHYPAHSHMSHNYYAHFTDEGAERVEGLT